MASYSVSDQQNGAWEKTLTANAIDTITFASDRQRVEIYNESTSGIYVTVNGTDPVVGAGAAWYVPPNTVAHLLCRGVVKVISTAAGKYSVGAV